MKKDHSRDDLQDSDDDRFELPFESHRTDWVEWIYDHRIALLVTVGVYLLLALGVITSRVRLGSAEPPSAFFVEVRQLEELMQEKERLEQEVRQMQELRQAQGDYYRDIRNLISNQEGQQGGRSSNAGARDAQGTQGDHIYEEARELEENLRASREAYEEGVRDAARILEGGRTSSGRRGSGSSGGSGGTAAGGESGRTAGGRSGGSDSAGGTSQKVSGAVSISYFLPGRYDEDLYRPTYQCRGGGTVTVNIAVNRNGQVVSASVASGSASDPCLQEFAVRAAQASRFNFDGTADNRQSGTITYSFVPQ